MNSAAIHSDPFEATVQAFEQAWQAGVPRLEDFLSKDEDCKLLEELIQVDLEFRWRSTDEGVRGRTLETYLKRFPRLATAKELSLALIAQEYRVRQRWGDRPVQADYVARFPGCGAELTAALEQADQELADEGTPPRSYALGQDPSPEVPLLAHEDLRLRRLIGAGGIARVYAAVDVRRRQAVAVKVLKPRFWPDPAAVGRFCREADVVRSLDLPGVAAIHGRGRLPGGGHFLVLDLIDGGDFDSWCGSRRPLAARFSVIAQVARTMAAVHSHGVVHCDLKPANVLVDATGRAWVTDFGFACQWDDPPRDFLGGTLAFMAPEQMDHRHGPIGPASDVWGLGGLLHFALCGRGPREGEVVPPAVAARGACDEVRTLLRECLAADAAARPSARQVAGRLAAIG